MKERLLVGGCHQGKTVSQTNTTYQQIYEMAMSNGCGHALADMLASRRAPQAQTDREFFLNQGKLGEQVKDKVRLRHYIRQAKKHGYNPSPNDVYMTQLARFPGDPEAFVSPSGGRNQVKRTLEKRGWGSEGLVNVKPAQYTPAMDAPDIPLGEDIVRDVACEMVKKDPSLRKKKKAELREMVIDKHGKK